MPTRKIDWTEIDKAYIRDGKTPKELVELPSAKAQNITAASLRTHLSTAGLTARKSKQKQIKTAKWEADENGFRAHNLAKLQEVANYAYAQAVDPETKDRAGFIRAASAAIQTAMDVAGISKAPKKVELTTTNEQRADILKKAMDK